MIKDHELKEYQNKAENRYALISLLSKRVHQISEVNKGIKVSIALDQAIDELKHDHYKAED